MPKQSYPTLVNDIIREYQNLIDEHTKFRIDLKLRGYQPVIDC